MLELGLHNVRALSERVPMMDGEIEIRLFNDSEEAELVALIKRSIASFEIPDAVVRGTLRRVKRLSSIYNDEGARLLVARTSGSPSKVVACVGLGPLHGLPLSEGVGELRDLIVDFGFRGQGLGSRLLRRSIELAKGLGYDRLYLETSPSMLDARKLFLRSGFRPVTNDPSGVLESPEFPCYFLLEKLQESQR